MEATRWSWQRHHQPGSMNGFWAPSLLTWRNPLFKKKKKERKLFFPTVYILLYRFLICIYLIGKYNRVYIFWNNCAHSNCAYFMSRLKGSLNLQPGPPWSLIWAYLEGMCVYLASTYMTNISFSVFLTYRDSQNLHDQLDTTKDLRPFQLSQILSSSHGNHGHFVFESYQGTHFNCIFSQ